jgi:aldose sugar dehydrogenase
VPIASPDTRPDLAKPAIYWTPVIAPGNIMFYNGSVFPQWNGNALITGLATEALVRVTFDGKGGATAVQRWSLGKRIRDIEEAPDGSLWMLEDNNPGGLFHLTPK